jgi:putative RNA 2'-phosphotransferase
MSTLKHKIGKYLCYMLRHDEKFVLDSEGWVNSIRIIEKLKRRFDELRIKDDNEVFSIIMNIVNSDDKKRYSIKKSSDVTWIRCDYGHSNKNINIEYINSVPPLFLYHGTSKENYEKIIESGKIDMMQRNNIHLSKDICTAIKVGERHGDPVVIVLNAYDMYKNGINFHKMKNDTWIVDESIDTAYIAKLIDTETCNMLSNSNKNSKEINRFNFPDTIDCRAMFERISDHSSHMTINEISNMFNKLVELGKGDYNINICGSDNYYLYIINDPENEIISIDTSPDEFQEYFDE